MDKYVHTHPQFPRKPYHKCKPVFRPKRRKNPTWWGGTYLYGLYKGVNPPQGETTFNFATSPLVSPRNDVWENERRNSILRTRHYPDLGSDTSSVRGFLLRSFLRCRYAGKPVVASQNVGGFLSNLLTVKMENAMNTRNTAIIARFILKWSVNLN